MTSYVLNTSGDFALKGLVKGTDIQAYSGKLADIAGLAPTSGNYIKWNGSHFVDDLPSGSSYSAGTALNLSSTTFSVKYDNSTIAVDGSSNLQVKDAGITKDQLNANVAGTGLTGGAGSALAVDSSVVQTTGNFDLAGVIQFQNSVQYQKSGMSGYAGNDVYELQTTDNSEHQLAQYAIPSNGAFFLSADIVCCSDDLAHFAQFSVSGIVSNNAGTITTGTLNNSSIYSSDGGLACSLSVSGTDLNLNIVGLTGTNLRWNAKVKQLECPKYA